MCSTPAVADAPISTHVIEFPYTRTLGPVVGPFLTGLRDGQILGIRSNDGRILVPPLEWDPNTGDALDTTALVPVGPGRRRRDLGLGDRADAASTRSTIRSRSRSSSSTAPTPRLMHAVDAGVDGRDARPACG